MDLPPEPPRLSGGRSWIDLVVAFSVIFISLVSLFIAMRQNRVMERQLSASVWPYVQFDNSNYDSSRQERAISLSLNNGGVGPARILALSLDYEGQPVDGWLALLNACCNPERKPVANIVSSGSIGRVLPANGEIRLLRLQREPGEDPVWDALNTRRFKIRGSVCYCSVLDQCFVTQLGGTTAQPVPDCEAELRKPQYRE